MTAEIVVEKYRVKVFIDGIEIPNVVRIDKGEEDNHIILTCDICADEVRYTVEEEMQTL